MKSAAAAQANWVGASGRATTAYTEGVDATQKDVAALAVAAIPRMVQGFNDAAASGRIAAGLQRGGTPFWKQQTKLKAPAYTAGYTNGGNNYGAAAQKFMPAIANIVQQLPARGDINQNIERVRTLALGLHSLKGQLGAR
jgi:hypothetical protein